MLRQAKFVSAVFQQLTTKRFAGHSKWANIKHDKAIKDAARANMFYRFSRMIRIAIQDGGSTNPATNSYLRTAIEQATKKNMPMSTINNQIKKFNANDAQLKRYFLEFKAQNRLFFICEAYTENLAMFKQNMNTVLRKSGGSMADVKHFFEETGLVFVTRPDVTASTASEFEDKLTEDAIESDAQEVEDIDFAAKSATFVCRPIDIEKVKRSLLGLGYTVEDSEHVFCPLKTVVPNEAEEKAFGIIKTKMSQIDGFENLYSNIEQPAS